MKIISVSVGGFKNLRETRVLLSSLTAIVSTNNYGKSNFLEAIDFGTDFLMANPKERKNMMKWIRGIPINKKIANDRYRFEIEFEDEALGEYRFVKYGFEFVWYRDDGSGQKIVDEWIEARPTESVRYTSFLKRQEKKYRKEKATPSYRIINLSDDQLAIDILSAIDDIEIHDLICAIKSLDYHVCSSLDLRDRYQPMPIEYVDHQEDGSVAFDDRDVPRALFKLKQYFPEKYNLFVEAIETLFPEFVDISVLPFEVRQNISDVHIFSSESDGDVVPSEELNEEKIPFKIRDDIYKVIISSRVLNQPIDMTMMSAGTKRIIWLLANVFIASSNNISLIGVEELETSIHPKLLKNLLEILEESLDNTSIIISSHSPYLVQYFKPDRIYVGVPTEDGTALFKRVKTSKVKQLLNAARDFDMSVGEYLFELMAGDEDSAAILSFYLEG